MSAKKVLVAGASGLVGQAAVRHFAARGDCEVVAVSRRPPLEDAGAEHVAADLLDAGQCREVFGALDDVTHLVYAAVHERPGLIDGWLEAEQIDANDRMLRNLLEPLDEAARDLRHVTVLQGTKAYGVHVAPIAIPAREDRDEHTEHANFYWRQQQYIREKRREGGWSWTIFRPQIVFGLSQGSAMNLIPVLGVYAALLRERGEPLAYPGGPSPILEATDADLLARAIDWAGESEAARDEIFNITNGDVFTWQQVWPALAQMLDMAAGPEVPRSLGETLPEEASAWDALRERYGLAAPALGELIGESAHYADFCMAYGAETTPPPALVSTVKLRRAGFHEVIDTEEMFRKWLRAFEARGLLPPPGGSAG